MSKIDYTKHKDKRVNNPTIEEQKFFVAEERKPYDTLYPRDPSLDPQLVWKGKDEQDRRDLAVPTVPIYIQEKIHPQAIIEDLRKKTKEGETKDGDQFTLFSDFNGLDAENDLERFQKQTEFYQHDKNWTNRMILGDSLLVMNSLAEKEGLKGKVQCIYIDPPYGIKFGSNWQVSTRKRDVKDGKAEDAAHEPEVIRAFRDTWALGIHSYLSYLRDRFVVARELLTETGSIFVQIGDENVHLVRCVLDEVFGSENFVATIPFAKTAGMADRYIPGVYDTLVWYGRAAESLKYRQLYADKVPGDTGATKYDYAVARSGEIKRLSNSPELGASNEWEIASIDPLTSQEFRPDTTKAYVFKGKSFHPGQESHWKTSLTGLFRLEIADRLIPQGNKLRYLRKLNDFPVFPLTNLWLDIGGIQSRTDPKVYVVQTSATAVQRCIMMSTDPGDLVLDPTCGSGTTAYVAEQWGRRWVTIDTSRVALALARTRLMSARFPYFLLADSPEGVKKESEITNQVPPSYPTANDVKKGFVYKRVPHVTLKSIANNPDIKEGMTREAIDKAIAKHADTELLFDQPYEDNKRIRVTGPFTVESLSPHRMLPASSAGDTPAEGVGTGGDFVTMVLDNLRKSGVQNTKKGERLKFDDLQPYAGRWIQAKGAYDASEGNSIRVSVSIGPEYGAVSPMQVKEAAKEAMEGFGSDILIVCGYAFDPHVTEESKQFGSLTVLPTRMNADLAMGDDLLKKTGAGNLFMVFGEPDLQIRREDGKVVVELHGLDVFDPTTGEIRSNSTDDIACWFIDTDYNDESFFVRHAYFTGAQEPYEKLKKALRAEIDEGAWSALYSTVSRPFDPPANGKIAVKVINHYGDEVLKVYSL